MKIRQFYRLRVRLYTCTFVSDVLKRILTTYISNGQFFFFFLVRISVRLENYDRDLNNEACIVFWMSNGTWDNDRLRFIIYRVFRDFRRHTGESINFCLRNYKAS